MGSSICLEPGGLLATVPCSILRLSPSPPGVNMLEVPVGSQKRLTRSPRPTTKEVGIVVSHAAAIKPMLSVER